MELGDFVFDADEVEKIDTNFFTKYQAHGEYVDVDGIRVPTSIQYSSSSMGGEVRFVLGSEKDSLTVRIELYPKGVAADVNFVSGDIRRESDMEHILPRDIGKRFYKKIPNLIQLMANDLGEECEHAIIRDNTSTLDFEKWMKKFGSIVSEYEKHENSDDLSVKEWRKTYSPETV